MSRRFGIEVEFGFQDGYTTEHVSRALREAGLGGYVDNYSSHRPTHWVLKTDASVRGGMELVSPPLDFDNEEERKQVTTAIEAIRPYAKTRTDAGVHVHVEATDLSGEQVSNVVRTFVHFEDILFRIASSGWNSIRPGRHMFAPLRQEQITQLARSKSQEDLRIGFYGRNPFNHSARYVAVNLDSYFTRGTIEFRIFNCTMNSMRAQTYLAVCQAIVEDGRRNHKRSVNRAYRLGGMANGSTDGAKAFFNFLTVVRYHAGMSLEDYQNLKKIWKDSRPQQPYHHSPNGIQYAPEPARRSRVTATARTGDGYYAGPRARSPRRIR